MRADWETGNTSQFSSVQRVAADRIQAVRAPVRQGSYAGRFQVSPGEDPFCPSGNCPGLGPRAEVSIDTNEKEGDERWYEWQMLVRPVRAEHGRLPGHLPVALPRGRPPAGRDVRRERQPAADGAPAPGRRRPDLVRPRLAGTREARHLARHQDAREVVRVGLGGLHRALDRRRARQTLTCNTQTLRIRTLIPGISNYFKQGYYRAASVGGTGVVYHDNFRMSAPGLTRPGLHALALVAGTAAVAGDNPAAAARSRPPGLELPAPQERPAERELVGVLQVGADGQPARQAGHPDPAPHQIGQVQRRGLARHGRVGGDHELGDAVGVDAGHELGDAQVLRVDAVDRRELAPPSTW